MAPAVEAAEGCVGKAIGGFCDPLAPVSVAELQVKGVAQGRWICIHRTPRRGLTFSTMPH